MTAATKTADAKAADAKAADAKAAAKAETPAEAKAAVEEIVAKIEEAPESVTTVSDDASSKVKLVHMYRESDGKTADVHPAEVENYKQGDFRIAE